MKTWLIVALAVGLLLFLTGRLLLNGYSEGEAERQWYVEQLGFKFSGKVDTVIMKTKYHGLVLFHLAEGTVDRKKEDRLNEQLVYNGALRFLVFRNDQVQFKTKIAYLYLPGDSLCVNTQKNVVVTYRKREMITRYPVTESLNERFSLIP